MMERSPLERRRALDRYGTRWNRLSPFSSESMGEELT